MHGLVTEIQRFSLHDGPGIRTTVFLKGCNMLCGWCHNPETISARPSLCYYPDRCIGCGRCVLACPHQAHQIKGTLHVIDRSLCLACGRCAAVCPTEALLMAGTVMTVDEVMSEVRQDRVYYDESGGGVTLSGGEVLCQPAFARALIDACRAEGFAVALETNLNAPPAVVADLAQNADLVMFDIKLIDHGAHQKETGAELTNVLDNARMLADMGISLIVRTPLIPGITDQAENVAGIAAFAAKLASVRYYELLNFNPLGASKYDSLDLPYVFKDSRPLSPVKLSHLKAVAEAAGITVKVN